MGIRGNFGGLRKIALKIKAASSPEFRADMAKIMMHEALELVDEGFQRGIAPNDSPWKKPAFRNGQPLRDTRRLQSSFTGASNARGFKIGTNVEYAVTHQDGLKIKAKGDGSLRFRAGGRFFTVKSVKIPKRQMVPEGRLSLRWSRALTDSAREFMATRMR